MGVRELIGGFELSSAYALVIAGVVILGLFLFWRGDSGYRPALILSAIACLALGFGGTVVDEPALWGWMAAMLPPLLILHHALFLSWVKTRFIPADYDPSGVPLERVLKDAKSSSDRYFSVSNISLRLGMPALILLLTSLTLVYALYVSTGSANGSTIKGLSVETIEGARFGAAGAYVYVLLYLGQRTFRHDITSGAALWCSISLVLGPILGGLLAIAWKGETGNVTRQLVFFGAGLSPKFVVEFVQGQLRKLLGDNTTAAVTARVLPLSLVGGITPEIEERLGEEGIADVYALAMSDPNSLLRNTAFSKKVILDWIDQALLIRYAPDHWKKLMELGVTGAIELAWFAADDAPEQEDTHVAGEVR